VLPKHAARKLIFDNPIVAERMLEHIAFKLRAATEYRVLLGLPNAFCRVYSLLQLLAKPDPGQLLTIENMPTHENVGLMTNTSRETVTRALHVVYESGILEKDGRRTIIRKPEALIKLTR
jgi:CRP-like cAMP-binding protein